MWSERSVAIGSAVSPAFAGASLLARGFARARCADIQLALTPLQLIDRLAALVPPTRVHRHRYHGVLAPNSPHRTQVITFERQAPPPSPRQLAPTATDASHSARRSPARILWALLLARIYEIFPLQCPLCGAQMRIIAFITEAPSINAMLIQLGEPTTPPEVAPARGPPLWDPAAEPLPEWGDSPAPVPELVFDQRLSW